MLLQSLYPQLNILSVTHAYTGIADSYGGFPFFIQHEQGPASVCISNPLPSRLSQSSGNRGLSCDSLASIASPINSYGLTLMSDTVVICLACVIPGLIGMVGTLKLTRNDELWSTR